MISMPFLKNLIFTLKGFIYLNHKLLNQKNMYIRMRQLNQDCLEHFFGSIRSSAVRYTNPSANHFIKSFKILIINNFLSTHSPSSNCENDKSSGALNNLKEFLIDKTSPKRPSLIEDSYFEIPEVSIRNTKISRCTLKYIAGYLIKKLKSKINCKFCKQNLMHSTNDNDLDFIISRTYKNSSLTIPGTFFYFITSRALNILFSIIPRVCSNDKLSLVLDNMLRKK